MKLQCTVLAAIASLTFACDDPDNNDACPDAGEMDSGDCLSTGGTGTSSTGDGGSDDDTGSGVVDSDGGAADLGTPDMTVSGDSGSGGPGWWLEVTGPLPIPRSEGTVVANTLTSGAGGLGGSGDDSAEFASVVNGAGAGPGEYSASSFSMNSPNHDYVCHSILGMTLTINSLDPLDADFEGTAICNAGEDIDASIAEDHTIVGHVQGD